MCYLVYLPIREKNYQAIDFPMSCVGLPFLVPLQVDTLAQQSNRGRRFMPSTIYCTFSNNFDVELRGLIGLKLLGWFLGFPGLFNVITMAFFHICEK